MVSGFHKGIGDVKRLYNVLISLRTAWLTAIFWIQIDLQVKLECASLNPTLRESSIS